MFARLFTGTLFLAVFVAGCSRSSIQQAEVSGKVLYHSKPLPGGMIIFVSSAGYSANAIIDPQGNYQLKAPVGEVRISVDNRMLNKNNPMRNRAARSSKEGKLKLPAEIARKQQQSQQPLTGTYVFLPKKFHTPDTSGLTYTVKPGSQTHDIELSASPTPGSPGS